jgi:hypothetical protein
MAVGDWSDTTDFWTGTPPILISAIKCNTMFLNTFRLLDGCERTHEIHRFVITNTVAGERYYYPIRITDDCPWNALTIIEKVKNQGGGGTANLSLVVRHVGAELMRSVTLDCVDFGSWVWYTVISNYDITGWAAGCHLVSVRWQPSGLYSCDFIDLKCRQLILRTTL